MSIHRFALFFRSAAARLGAVLLASAVLLPGAPTPIHAAAVLMHARPAPRPSVPAEPAANHAPVGQDDNLVAFADQDYQRLYVLANDSDPDAGDVLYIWGINYPQPRHGDIFRIFDSQGNGISLDYKPNPGFSGTEHFTYILEDRPTTLGGQPGGLTDTVSVTVTVVPAGQTGTTSSPFAVYSCLPSPSGCDTSLWTVNPNSGATGNTSSGACNGAPGLGIQDAEGYNFVAARAFDTGLTLWINNAQLTPRLPMTVTHYSLVSGPVTMSGVRVTVHYDGMIGSDTLRTNVGLANATGSPKTITVTVATNVGSDAQTLVAGTSSGDTLFTAADRWVVTSRNGGPPFALVDTHVLYGPGAAVPAGAVYNTTFKCGESPTPNSQGVRADFHVTIPANSTRRLLFFNQIHQTSDVALTDAAVFNAEPVGLLAGMTNNELGQVLNWVLVPVLRLFLPLVEG